MKRKFTMLLIAAMSFSYAQESTSYQKPSAEILKLADYTRPPSVLMDSKKEWMVFTYRPTYKNLKDLYEEDVKLAGLRINPLSNISSTITYIDNLKIKNLKGKSEVQVKGLPQNASLAYFSFSPDEKSLAFTNTTSKGVELWVVDLATATAKKITSDNLNANLGSPFTWFKDSKSFLINVLPANRPVLLSDKNDIPTGPTVATSTGKVSQNATFQDLLKTPKDETNFENLATSELAKVDLNGNVSGFAKSGMYASKSFSPDGNYIMISSIKKPFSYIVPLNRFPSETVVFDKTGQQVKVVNEMPLNEIMPKGFSSVRTGKRSIAWRSDMPATLYYVEALDGGDQSKKAEYRDQIYTWDAPFNAEAKALYKTKERFSDIDWGE